MKVLIAVDGSEQSLSVLSVLKTMAREPERAVVVRVQRSDGKSMLDSGRGECRVPGPAGSEARERRCEPVMNFYRRELERSGRVSVTTMVRSGNPSREILRAADEENVDLIIMGSSTGSVLRPAAGRVADEVERHATVPVLVAKANRFKKFLDDNWRGKEYAA